MPKPHLYIHVPTIVFQALVNMPGTITYPVTEITFDNVSLGDYTDVEFDATLLLGTEEGSDDLGRVRVKTTPTSNTITIARASKGIDDGLITIQDNAYITILDDYRPWAKLPYFELTNESFIGNDYKDSDIEAGTYNTNIPPVANAGPWVAGYVDPITNEFAVAFPDGVANLSFAMADGATISSYSWDVGDGTIIVGTGASAMITAVFNPGFRWVKLTVLDSNGVPHSARCAVLAIDPADDPCVKDFSMSQRLEKKGQTLEIEIYEDLPRSAYPDGTLVMMWWDEPADENDKSHMKFTGWIANEKMGISRKKTGYSRTTSLTAVDMAGYLALLPGFPQALERTSSDSPWSYMPSLDMNKALYYIIFWHSTAINLVDFFLPSDGGDYDAMRIDANGGSLFDQVNSLAMKMVPDHYLTCNTKGQLSVIRDWRLDDVGDRPTSAPIITEAYWNELSADYSRTPKVHSLRSGAILSSTAFVVVDTVDTIPLVFSVAPGDAAAFGQGLSEAVENEGLALSQDALNKSEGHRYAMLNARYGPFKFKDPTASNFWNYEPAAMKRVQLNIGEDKAAQRGLDFTTASGMVQSIAVDYKKDKTGLQISVDVTWEREVEGYPALTHTPEDAEDIGYTVPLLTPPTFGLVSGVEQVVLVNGDGYLCRTSNFQNTSPTWDEVSLDLGGGVLVEAFTDWVVDPFSPGYRGTPGGNINGWAATRLDLWRLVDLFGATPTATKILTFGNGLQGASANDMSQGAVQIGASFGRFQEVEANNPWLVVVSVVDRTGTGADVDNGAWCTYSTDAGVTWSTQTRINAFSPNSTGAAGQYPSIYLSPRTPGLAYTFAATSSSGEGSPMGFVSTDWGATWTQTNDPDLDNFEGYGGGIHIPWQDNTDESIIYHGWYDRGTPTVRRLKKVIGTAITDVSPTETSKVYGPVWGKFSIRAHDSNRLRMLMAGAHASGVSSSLTDWGVFLSEDGGDTWSVVYQVNNPDITYVYSLQVAWDGVDQNTFFVWGGVPGTGVAIAYSTDLGVSLDSKEGNLPTLYASNSLLYGFIGIAGGPTS